MCNCAGWARTFDEQLKSIPPSNHHPNCEDYKLVEYCEIKEIDGGRSLIVEKHELDDAMSNWDCSADNFTVLPIMLTADQYEKLQEFDGF
ncbi:MAG: hypothetical protein EOO52_13295 [Gammaproteobacteria bacterium]|nr:MAG: hypothetical protein EOO52_13295 [Gammaproteobacteria bacterium]